MNDQVNKNKFQIIPIYSTKNDRHLHKRCHTQEHNRRKNTGTITFNIAGESHHK